MIFDWNKQKNEELKDKRDISFEKIIFLIHTGHVLDILEHPDKDKYGDQKLYIVNVEGYAYVIPFIDEGDRRFLKTIFPSRKFTQKYLRETNEKSNFEY